jgi:hypothetical protein
MSSFPATTIKVTGIEPCGEAKVCIMMEMVVDVHRLAEISGELMRTAVRQMKSDGAKKKRDR